MSNELHEQGGAPLFSKQGRLIAFIDDDLSRKTRGPIEAAVAA